MRRSFFSNRSFKFILGGLVFLFVLITIKDVYTQPPSPTYPYTLSAHGNTTYGVNRPRTVGFGYSRGNCAHCHEQHASIGGQIITPQKYALFYGVVTICDMVCFQCHRLTAPEQEVLNYLYCVNFGGRALAFPGILDHFCASAVQYNVCGSRHHLGRIYNTIRNNAYGWGYGSDPTPCDACHNVHMSQRIGATQYHGPYNPSKSPIQRVTEHNNPTKRLNLWGDDASERMDQYASSVGGHYLAPYYGSFGGGQYEPAGQATPTDGSNLPDYVTFCMDCHQYAFADPDRSEATVKAINWSSTGDKHGGRASGDYDYTEMWETGDLRAPYSDANKEASYNYVLSCTDCHEPHGSPNRLHLIRRFVNGENVAAETVTCNGDDDYQALCGRCHINMHTFGGCFVCHSHGSYNSYERLF